MCFFETADLLHKYVVDIERAQKKPVTYWKWRIHLRLRLLLSKRLLHNALSIY